MDSSGLSECSALASPGMALEKPGVVYIATPGSPVMRPQASAICAAACSWRVSTNRKPISAIVSSAGST